MKKIKRDYQENYPFVRLYKNDLDDLVAVFEKNCTKVELKADEYELADASQLNNIRKQMITELAIDGRLEEHSYFDAIRLRLSKQYAFLRLEDDANITYSGMASQVRSILRRRAKIRVFLASFKTLIIFMALSLILNAIDIFTSHINIQIDTLSVISSVILLIYAVWFFYIRTARVSVIFLVNEDNRPNFFRKYRDQILLNMISAISGAALALLVAWLTSHHH